MQKYVPILTQIKKLANLYLICLWKISASRIILIFEILTDPIFCLIFQQVYPRQQPHPFSCCKSKSATFRASTTSPFPSDRSKLPSLIKSFPASAKFSGRFLSGQQVMLLLKREKQLVKFSFLSQRF